MKPNFYISEKKVKKLFKNLKGYRKESVLGPLGKLLEATLELIVPLVIALVIDNGIEKADKTYVIKMSLLLVLIGLVGLGFSCLAQFYCAKASVGFITKTKKQLFAHLQTLSYSDVDKIGTSTMITRMTADSAKVQTGLNLALRLLLRSPFVVFGAMIMAFTISPKAGISFAIVIPLLSVVVFGIMIISMPLYKKVQTGVDKILSKTRENLSGVRVVRAFGKEESEIEKFVRANESLTHSQKYVGKVSSLMNPLTYVIINLGILLLIYIGALEVDSGDLTKGQVIALYNYMSQILVELIKLANLIISITKALASASRIASVFEIRSSMSYGNRESSDESEYVLEIRDGALRYPKSSENSVEGINLSVRRGETVGIIGGTGSGKSSLISLIPRFYDATDGEVRLYGNRIEEYSKSFLEGKIGIVPQKAVLFSGSIKDNLLFGNPNATYEDMERALSIAQATDVVESKGGLDAKIEAGGKNLSGGQRQRLTIARALVKKPEILILDDSASALDYATDASLRIAIKNELNDTTVFIVSQRTASVMHADKILVLEDGQVISSGTHEELLKNSGVYREIHESQFEEDRK